VTLIGIRTGFVIVEPLSRSLLATGDVAAVELLSATAAAASAASVAAAVRRWKSMESLPSTSVTSRPNVHGWSGLISAV